MDYTLRKKISLITLLITFNASPVLADSITNIGRYLTVENKPTHVQTDLLSQTIQVRFPQNVQTVGDAIHYILRLSGYSLVSEQHMHAALKNTLTKPLPAVDRDLGPMTLKDALTTLVGPAFYLKQDALNRTIDFHVKSAYQAFLNDRTDYT